MAGGRKLTRLRILTPEQCSKLRQRGITTGEEFISANVLELMAALSLSHNQLHTFTQALSHSIAPQPKNVLDMFRERGEREFVSSSLPQLDVALHGGLPCGTVTELVGPPGSGKTQLCLTVALTTALPPACGGCGMGVVFIDTEATFSASRLLEMARARHPSHFSHPHTLTQLGERVRVHQALTSAELERALASLEEELAEMGVGQGAGLVVVDSVAAPVRREFGAESGREMAERAAALGGITARLKYLAELFHISVIVTNQIAAGVSHDQERDYDWLKSGGRGQVTAALGNTWAHCVNTRLFLDCLPESHRLLTVEKSPVSRNERFIVQINEMGVVSADSHS